MEYQALQLLELDDLREQLEDMGIPTNRNMSKKDLLDAYLLSLRFVQEPTITLSRRRTTQ